MMDQVRLVKPLAIGACAGALISGCFMVGEAKHADYDRALFASARLADGTEVSAEMQFAAGQGCADPHNWRWGAEGECPRLMARRLDVRLRGGRLFVPLSAFSDFGNLRNIRIVTDAAGFTLLLGGGDAATSYRASLRFQSGRITERIVQHGEFPDEAWEKTQYGFPGITAAPAPASSGTSEHPDR